jgi:hypothetical protein
LIRERENVPEDYHAVRDQESRGSKASRWLLDPGQPGCCSREPGTYFILVVLHHELSILMALTNSILALAQRTISKVLVGCGEVSR